MIIPMSSLQSYPIIGTDSVQLILPVSLPIDETFDSFIPGANAEVVSLLQDISARMSCLSPDEYSTIFGQLSIPLISVAAGKGMGKSHLLYALCHLGEVNSLSHCYLNLADEGLDPRILDALEHYRFVCLDNIDSVVGQMKWEEALFDLFNRVMETQTSLVVTTMTRRISNVKFSLPDLLSRLQWGLNYTLQPLNDSERLSLLKLRSEQRGIRFSRQALSFILSHSDRHPLSLMQLLERLDRRSLSEMRKVSVNMVKRELGI